MNVNIRHQIEIIFNASNQGKIHFGQVIEQLMAIEVESYQVDYRSGRSTFYSTDGETIDLSFDKPKQKILNPFNVEVVRSAILGAQQGHVMYPEFKQLTQNAGCIGYNVWILGRHVTYLGRNGEMHIEQFPS